LTDTTFVNNVTLTDSDWFNDVNRLHYTIFGDPATKSIAGQAIFPAGTRIVFQQTAAPTGWTKDTTATYNDAALRFTTGTVGTGGADAFNTLFGTSKSTAGYTLATADIPSHSHVEQIADAASSILQANSWTNTGGGTKAGITPVVANANTFAALSTQATGGGGSHSHTLSNFDLKWADCIIASKD